MANSRRSGCPNLCINGHYQVNHSSFFTEINAEDYLQKFGKKDWGVGIIFAYVIYL